jgi:putative dimethyl sulfoxide reductase chaperone
LTCTAWKSFNGNIRNFRLGVSPGRLRDRKRRIVLILEEDEKQTLLEVIQKMSHLFWGPTLEQCENMLQVPYWLPFERVLPWLDSPPDIVFKEVKTLINNFSTAGELFDFLEEAYVRLFISDRQGIRAPLYASCYVGEEPGGRAPLMGEPAIAMEDRFRSKGLSLADDIGEPPDHLSIELEYLYFLLRKGWTDNDNQLVNEASSLASETMLPWVMKLQQALAEIETAGPFYPLLTTLLCAILAFIGELNRRS